jgi:hypothetical protein
MFNGIGIFTWCVKIDEQNPVYLCSAKSTEMQTDLIADEDDTAGHAASSVVRPAAYLMSRGIRKEAERWLFMVSAPVVNQLSIEGVKSS